MLVHIYPTKIDKKIQMGVVPRGVELLSIHYGTIQSFLKLGDPNLGWHLRGVAPRGVAFEYNLKWA